MRSTKRTRVLVLSDTHASVTTLQQPEDSDVVIHCGDLTDGSTLDEFVSAINLLRSMKASLKLCIPGNHDFTLDTTKFSSILKESKLSIDDPDVIKTYGKAGDARALFEADDVKAAGIVYLEEGTHTFRLASGADLTVYASPYTPAKDGGMGFQYCQQDEDHEWTVTPDIDIAITHGPPHGIFDQTADRVRVGSPSLFKAIARVRPRVHCFGHIHQQWSAKSVTWRAQPTDSPSHFTDIDHEKTRTFESLASIRPRKFDTPEIVKEKADKLQALEQSGCCLASAPSQHGEETLFVNAAIEGSDEYPQHLPWLVEIELPLGVDAAETAIEAAETKCNDEVGGEQNSVQTAASP